MITLNLLASTLISFMVFSASALPVVEINSAPKPESHIRRVLRTAGGVIKGVAMGPFYAVGHLAKAVYDFTPNHHRYESYGGDYHHHHHHHGVGSIDILSGFKNIGHALISPFYMPYKEGYNAWHRREISTGEKMYLGDLHHHRESNAHRQQLFKIIHEANLDPDFATSLQKSLKRENIDTRNFKIYRDNLNEISALNRALIDNRQVLGESQFQSLRRDLIQLEPLQRFIFYGMKEKTEYKTIKDAIDNAVAKRIATSN